MKKIGLLSFVSFTIFAFVAMNSHSTNAQVGQGIVCPAGYTCTPKLPICPTGYACTPSNVDKPTFTPSFTPPSPVKPCLNLTTYLKVGDTGTNVSLLQNFLIAKGYSFPSINSGASPRGYFGIETQSAVMEYQRSIGVPNTGFVGPLTMAAINGSCGNNTNSGNNQNLIKVLNPNSGIVDSSDQFKVQWTGYSGDFDYYQIILGNSIANVEVSLDENTKISKYQNNYNSFAVWYFVKQITDGSGLKADKIKDAYYIKVNAVKTDVAGGGVVGSGKGSLFSITSSYSTPSPSPIVTPNSYIISPKGGEIYSVGNKILIKWNEKYTRDVENYTILLKDSKTTRTIANNIMVRSSGIDGSSSFEWVIPQLDNGNNYQIDIYRSEAREANIWSGKFSITSSYSTPSPSPTPTSSQGSIVR